MRQVQSNYKRRQFYTSWNRLSALIDREQCLVCHPTISTAQLTFLEPYLRGGEVTLLVLAVMRLLIQCGYNKVFLSAKVNIGYVMQLPSGEVIQFMLPSTISLNDAYGNAVPNKDTFEAIERAIEQAAEDYGKYVIKGLFIRVYYVLKERVKKGFKGEEVFVSPLGPNELQQVIMKVFTEVSGPDGPYQEELKRSHISRRYPHHMPVISKKEKVQQKKPFVVADIETVLLEGVHVPYAVGFMTVNPYEDIRDQSYKVELYFSEDLLILSPSFHERSHYMFNSFLERLVVVRQTLGIKHVYFHNLSRFDGILMLKHLVQNERYDFKTLVRNHRVYEISVYRRNPTGKNSKDNKLLFRLRDSITLLPSSLSSLAKTLCPELGVKGVIPHEDINEVYLKGHRDQLMEYLKQDIRLLGGIMVKAQDIYWTNYQVDILDCLTLSSLAMRIYRTCYYDSENWPIHLPSRNEDSFIRRGYYGGHADVYIPYGENLWYYDVNSLYPYIMRTKSMPGGVPVWHGNLEGADISNLFGFIEVYVVCPETIHRPFLPYRDSKTNSLLFPVGKFVGVYFSEELKYAQQLGYTIVPIRGYLFERKDSSPFEGFISSLYARRQMAKKEGDEAMSYIYKILMNSLYGRFGINPNITVSDICEESRYQELLNSPGFISAYELTDRYFIVTYKSGPSDPAWKPPTLSAVQMSAAITAYARIHMYPYISRPDCYYTDTDSAVLGSPLPEEEVSSVELGKVKLEFSVNKGIFLAPKTYYLVTDKGSEVLKHKGQARDFATPEWFVSQYADVTRTESITADANFRINWNTLDIAKKEIHVNLGIQLNAKRLNLYDEKGLWVGTCPKEVVDLSYEEPIILRYEMACKDKIIEELKHVIEKITKKEQQSEDKFTKMEQQSEELQSEVSEEPKAEEPPSEVPRLPAQPKLFMHPPKKRKKSKLLSQKKKEPP